jgi:NodT family efflux transporter outer membrane factor (OMF) lipoprotein
MVTLYAEVAMAYLDVRSSQQRILFAKANSDSQQQSLAFAQDRFNSGVASKLDVMQAQANLLTTDSSIPSLNISLNQAINRLAVLIGQDAGSLQSRFSETGPLPQATDLVGIGVPADVLRQRPDIRKAERLLAAQTAQIGVATAELYPSFSLAGFFGLQSRSLSNLFDSSSFTYGVQAPVQWSLLNGDRVRGNIQVQTEKTQQRLLMYENQVLQAVEEVENAIAGFNLNNQRSEILFQAAAATSEAVDLVLTQYNTGLTGFNNVLVTQRDLFELQDQLVVSEAQISANLVGLYKALGGGWDVEKTVQLDAADQP